MDHPVTTLLLDVHNEFNQSVWYKQGIPSQAQSAKQAGNPQFMRRRTDMELEKKDKCMVEVSGIWSYSAKSRFQDAIYATGQKPSIARLR